MDDAALAASAATDAGANRGRTVILVIDDADDSRDLYAEFLGLRGYRVLTAADGADGLRIAREIRPDVIVLDLGLPVVSGWDIARLLRGDPLTKAIYIIACSAFAAAEDQRRALEAGVDTYLVKPCSPDALQAAVLQRLKAP